MTERNISGRIRDRIKAAGGSFLANDNIADFIDPSEREAHLAEVERAVEALLDALVIDREHDHNTRETPKRVARMYVEEVFRGRYHAAPKITDFPNAKHLDEVYTVGPIAIRSACSHHMVPILGQAWVGVIPGSRVIGLSKFNRLVDWIVSRPQIQEEAAVQVADELERAVQPEGLAVVIKARHLCCEWRGVRDRSEMTTSVMRGVFRTDNAARAEFLNLIAAQGFTCR